MRCSLSGWKCGANRIKFSRILHASWRLFVKFTAKHSPRFTPHNERVSSIKLVPSEAFNREEGLLVAVWRGYKLLVVKVSHLSCLLTDMCRGMVRKDFLRKAVNSLGKENRQVMSFNSTELDWLKRLFLLSPKCLGFSLKEGEARVPPPFFLGGDTSVLLSNRIV